MVKIDLNSDIPIYLQLKNQIILAIARGEVGLGEPLPTVRQLAEDMGVNPMTISKVYAELKNEGFLESNIRHGTAVKRIIEKNNASLNRMKEELELLLAKATLRGHREEEVIQLVKDILSGFGRE